MRAMCVASQQRARPWLLLLAAVVISAAGLVAAPQEQKGEASGVVVDFDTKLALPGATVRILETGTETTTDMDGSFAFGDLDVGTYSVRVSYPGMIALTTTDVVVKSARTTHLTVAYRLVPAAKEDVTVTSGYFAPTADQPTSAIGFSSEEIRRAPGSGGDVSRIIYGLPSLAKVDDMMNSLVVRGGNPSENTFFIDNIEVPNINHFPMQGTSGGPVGLLNVDFIQDVSFYSGGFSTIYGNRLSSVMDINYRRGNRDKHEEQADLNFAGAGLAAEGPLSSRGSWMVSARMSYLDLLVGLIGTGAAPRYGDVQGKLSLDLSDRDKLTVLGITGIDQYTVRREEAIEQGSDHYMQTNSREGVIGFNWFRVWGEGGYSSTSLAHSFTAYDSEVDWTQPDSSFMENSSTEQLVTLRNVNHYTFGSGHTIRTGFEGKWVLIDYDLSIASYTDVLGRIIPASSRRVRGRDSTWSAFVDSSTALGSKLTLNAGLRADYYTYSRNGHASPRLSMSYALTDRTSLTASAGLFYQQLPLVLLYRNDRFSELADPLAYHYIIGFSRLLSDNTKLTVEAYDKEYRNLPVDPTQPTLFVFDDLYGWSFPLRDNLSDAGLARSRGIEFIIQKKLKARFYGMVSGSWSTSRYRASDAVWRNRQFDNRYILSVEGGYKRSRNWEYSLRWILAGGRPYTPFDLDASRAANAEILDVGKTNGARMPAYHSLNIRFDRRFYFGGSNLTLYLSVWNTYNRKNVADYFWNNNDNEPGTRYQWSVVPVGGIEYEF
ncbi:MAG: TonB-dependent receptor [Acidobacteria bacterium]|nr:TonB-dependent receptor [Acidobacteriota bacterium]